jgi:glycosyltransferase involved in cell wall biosynthesis
MVVAPRTMPLEPIDESLTKLIPPQTSLYYEDYPTHGLLHLFRFVYPKEIWLPRALRGSMNAIRCDRPDVLLTSGPPHSVHFLGLLLQRWYRLPWVADLRDPWVTGAYPRPRLSLRPGWTGLGEWATFRNANLIIANAPLACAAIQAAYPDRAGKMITITNGYDPESFGNLDIGPIRRGSVQMVHAGELYAGRDPRPFLDALGSLAPGEPGIFPPLQVRFLGRIDQMYRLDLEIEERGLTPMVEVCGHVGYRQIIQELVHSDILLLMDTPGRRVGVPAKLYEYLGAGRPILALTEPNGDVANVLRQSGITHRIAGPLDRARIRDALADLVKGVTVDHGLDRRPDDRQRFTRENATRQLAAAMDRLFPLAPGTTATTNYRGELLEPVGSRAQ